MELHDVIADNVKGERARLGLTQQEVADRTNGVLTRIALSTTEQHERTVKVDELPALCRALGVDLGVLMRGYPGVEDLLPAGPPRSDEPVAMMPTGPLAQKLWPDLEPMVRAAAQSVLREAFHA